MTSFRRLASLLVGLTLALGGGSVAWFMGTDAAAVTAVKTAPPGSQPNGVSFTIHSEVDPTYCVENTASVVTPASEATMSQCVARDSQFWTFANAADGSIIIVGSNGDCVDFGPGKTPTPVSVTPCTFKSVQHFYYTPTGQIESTSGKKCLQIAQAAQNASIYVATCDATNRNQVWPLGH
jgi:hypothetical protein